MACHYWMACTEAEHQVAIRLAVEFRQVESGRESAPAAREHHEARAATDGLAQARKRALHQVRIDGVELLRTVQGDSSDGALVGHRNRLYAIAAITRSPHRPWARRANPQ